MRTGKLKPRRKRKKLKEQESTETSPPEEEKQPGLPPADFSGLVSILATQAFYALGIFRMDEKEQPEPNFELAKFNIDMLGILEEKCKGNLIDDESKMLKNTLDQLRMAFVQLSK